MGRADAFTSIVGLRTFFHPVKDVREGDARSATTVAATSTGRTAADLSDGRGPGGDDRIRHEPHLSLSCASCVDARPLGRRLSAHVVESNSQTIDITLPAEIN
jgi:hypothetical protein